MGKITAQLIWLLCLCWLPELYLSIPIKAVRNKTWEWSGLRWSACVCALTEEVAFLLKQLSLCLRAALVRVVTHSRIIIGCVTSITQTLFFPRYVGWCHSVCFITFLVFIIFYSRLKKLPPENFPSRQKTENKNNATNPPTPHPTDMTPKHMRIPCLSSIINNFGKLWINTFPVTCRSGGGLYA